MVIDRLARGNCSSTLRTAQAETQMSSAATSALNILKQIKPSRQTQHLLRPLASFPVTPRLPIWTSPSNSRTMATSSSAQTSSSDAVRSKSRVEKRPGPVESSMYLKVSLLWIRRPGTTCYVAGLIRTHLLIYAYIHFFCSCHKP